MNSITLDQLIPLLPELLLVLAAIIIMLLPRKAGKAAWVISAATLAAAAVMCAMLWGVEADLLGSAYRIDGFCVFAQVMLLSLGFINIIGSVDFTSGISRAKEYYALLLTAMLGLVLIPGATDYITLTIGFELASIATYTLPMIDPANSKGREASLKYYLMGAFSSALIFYGLSLLYGFTGTLQIRGTAEVIQLVGVHPVLAAAFVLMLAGYGYKMALVPLHMWAADTYSGASSPTTGFISGVTQKGAFIVAMKVVLVTFGIAMPAASAILGLLCVVSMTVGNVLALLQDDVKRMLAYSSVAHAGNILVGITVATGLAMAGAFLHIWAHALMTIGGFFVLRMVAEAKGGTQIKHFRGLAREMPYTSVAFMLILLSYGGIPPLLGFWGKMLMTVAVVGRGGWYTVLALLLVLNSALSLVYYARVIREMYAKPSEVAQAPDMKRGFSWQGLAVWLAVGLLLGLGLFPGQLTDFAITAVNALA